MSSGKEIIRQVTDRAEERCEYCRMHQSLQGASFHIEHIVPSVRGGPTEVEKLALACPGCNLHKSDRVHATDPATGATVPLFHPRRDDWNEHFRWDGYELIGETPVGRATAATLDLNHPRRIRIRQAEEIFGLFPP